MTKVNLNNVNSLQNENSAVAIINGNSATIETAFDNTLSRDGSTPNSMGAQLDMNSNRIINLPAASADSEPVRKAEFDEIVLNGMPTITVGDTITTPPGTDAEVTNVGDQYNLVLDFSIPQGSPGTGTGDVIGPSSAVSGNIATFSGTTGKLIADSGSSLSTINTSIGTKASKSGDTFTGDVNVPNLAASGSVAATSFIGSGTSLTGVETTAHAAATYSPIIRTTDYRNTSLTLDLTQIGKVVLLDYPTPGTITIPANATVAFPLGTQIDFIQANTGKPTFSPAGGVNLVSLSSNRSLGGQGAACTLYKHDTNIWWLFGALTA